MWYTIYTDTHWADLTVCYCAISYPPSPSHHQLRSVENLLRRGNHSRSSHIWSWQCRDRNKRIAVDTGTNGESDVQNVRGPCLATGCDRMLDFPPTNNNDIPFPYQLTSTT
jgi:hypothetical protein